MPDLLDALADVWTDAPEWEPLLKRWDADPLVNAVTEERCRDCGKKAGFNQGGSGREGMFMVCDDCASLDACTTRQHDRGPEWHVSHWGLIHAASDHDALLKAQAKRRATYLAAVAREIGERDA